ncbi:MAG TPA: hypothetical protein VII69_11650 [Candidatus Eremiobacteraceae bacterium]
MTASIQVPAGATPDEATAIADAIQSILNRMPDSGPSDDGGRSKWAAAARREALDDRV